MKRKNHTKKTKFSGHNQRKLSILLVCFNDYYSAAEIAEATFSEALGIDLAHHTQNIRESLWRYRHAFDHPYIDSKPLKKAIVYRANEKGKRVCCELHFRENHGLSLNWKHSRLHYRSGKGQKKLNKYNIRCLPRFGVIDCGKCQYNPTRLFIDPEPSLATCSTSGYP